MPRCKVIAAWYFSILKTLKFCWEQVMEIYENDRELTFKSVANPVGEGYTLGG